MPTVLVKSVGLPARQAQLISGFVELMFIVGNLLPAFALDRMGRRKTMMFGVGGLGLCMMMVSILLSFGKRETSIAAVAFFFLYMLIFGATINVVPWVYGPEILPLEARTRGTAISVSNHWFWNSFVVMITPVLINRLSWKTYLIFMCTSFSFVPIVYFFYPETSNLSLEDVDKIFLPRDQWEASSSEGSINLDVDSKAVDVTMEKV
jgi:MFS family permease